jgi:hypothetical protein
MRMKLATYLFALGALVVFYAYAGYPAILLLLTRLRKRRVRSADHLPEVTVIVPVFNQPEAIERKVENLLALDYPREKMQLLVASDGSTDRTDEVIRAFADRGVRLVRSSERRGKEAAQNLAIAEARGTITVFTDATILLERGSLRAIVRPFADSEVGCVSSEDDVPGGGEGLYVRYEMFLRRLESAIDTLIGVSGSFYAVRTELLGPTDPRYTRDFLVPLDVIDRGKRVVSEPAARGRFLPAGSASGEFRRKVRTVLRGMDVVGHRARLLNPLRRPFVAWALLSHKVARWGVPWALLLLFGASGVLAGRAPYAFLFGVQALFYFSGIAAFLWERWSLTLPGKAASFFLVTNAAVLVASVRFAFGERAVLWEPTTR